jgi:hypothetical protein
VRERLSIPPYLTRELQLDFACYYNYKFTTPSQAFQIDIPILQAINPQAAEYSRAHLEEIPVDHREE